MNPREDALRRTSAAAELCEVPESRVTELQAQLGDVPVARMTYAGGYLHARLIAAAEEHRRHCGGAGCRTCEHLSDAEAMMLAFLRAELDDEFRGQLNTAPPRWRWLFGSGRRFT